MSINQSDDQDPVNSKPESLRDTCLDSHGEVLFEGDIARPDLGLKPSLQARENSDPLQKQKGSEPLMIEQ